MTRKTGYLIDMGEAFCMPQTGEQWARRINQGTTVRDGVDWYGIICNL